METCPNCNGKVVTMYKTEFGKDEYYLCTEDCGVIGEKINPYSYNTPYRRSEKELRRFHERENIN